MSAKLISDTSNGRGSKDHNELVSNYKPDEVIAEGVIDSLL